MPATIRNALILAFAAAVSACGTSSGGVAPTLDAFPPMPNDKAPGASAKANDTLKALGRGVNFGNIYDAPREGDWGLVMRDEFIDVTASAGFNSVRVPVRWSNHAAGTAPYAIDETFMAHVEDTVDKLLARNLYVVLNMHHYRQFDGDPVDPNETPVDAAVLDERFLTLWRQIAERFKGRGDHLVFELYNEPHGRLTASKWNDLAARALQVVRANNPDRVVVIGPVQWNSADALSGLKLPNDANLIVTVHNYAPFNFTHQGAEWVSPPLPTGQTCCTGYQESQLTAPLDTAKKWADANRYPVYLGEFGAYSKADMDSRANYTRLMRDAAEARGMGWAYWELAAGFGVYDPAAHVFREPLRNALLGN